MKKFMKPLSGDSKTYENISHEFLRDLLDSDKCLAVLVDNETMTFIGNLSEKEEPFHCEIDVNGYVHYVDDQCAASVSEDATYVKVSYRLGNGNEVTLLLQPLSVSDWSDHCQEAEEDYRNECPSCGSDDIDYYRYEVHEDLYYDMYKCMSCQYHGEKVYSHKLLEDRPLNA